jgi:hypothetical protein
LKILCSFTAFVTLFFFPVGHSLAGVIAFDEITSLGHPVFIRVLTKGKFFAAGGQRVTVQIGEQMPQLILTGGDGYGRIKFVPEKTGTITISVKYKEETDSAELLILKKTESLLLIEVDVALRNGIFSPTPLSESQAVLKDLASEFYIVYLYGIVGKHPTKAWLESNQFPQGILLQNKGIATITDLIEKNIMIKGFIGSAKTASEAAPYIEKAIAFEKIPGGIKVGNWKEVKEVIKQPDKEK